MRRRRFISALLGGTALAGCTSPVDTVARTTVPAPELRTELLRNNGWEKIADRSTRVFKREFGNGLVTVAADQHTTVYEDTGLRREIRTRTLGQFDAALSTFFATRVDLSPDLESLPFGIGLKEIQDRTKKHSERQLRKQLSEAGLSDIRTDKTGSLTVDTGETADLTRYEADYRFESIEVPVREGKTLSIPGRDVTVVGLLAIWQHEDYLLVSGGAYPGEDFEETVTETMTEAITVSVDIDLGLHPDRLRRELLGLVRSVR